MKIKKKGKKCAKLRVKKYYSENIFLHPNSNNPCPWRNPPLFFILNIKMVLAPCCWLRQARSICSTPPYNLPTPFPGYIPPATPKLHLSPGTPNSPSHLTTTMHTKSTHYSRALSYKNGLAEINTVSPSYTMKYGTFPRHTCHWVKNFE